MLDSDLAKLYQVITGNFNKAVTRNLDRFPEDFMFELTKKEFEQINNQNNKHGGRRKMPRVFTESGVAMLSGVLNSTRAIQVNISIMRAFVTLRRLLRSEESLAEKIHHIEENSNKLFKIVFRRLDDLEIVTPLLPSKRKKIGLK